MRSVTVTAFKETVDTRHDSWEGFSRILMYGSARAYSVAFSEGQKNLFGLSDKVHRSREKKHAVRVQQKVSRLK